MVVQEKLSAVLGEFARTLATDFPIQSILDHLVGRIVGVLPITAAGVTLISPGRAPRYVAASDDSALRFERLQTELGDGPCVLAYTSGLAVTVPDLSREERFPNFAPAAVDAGLAAVFTFPLRDGDGRLGALDLYRDTAGPLHPSDMDAAQILADVAAAYLLNAQARESARATSELFRHTAMHDSLTGLPNRLLLEQRIEHAAHRARRSHNCAAILFVDIDRFKQINDTYGHQTGDHLLLEVAHRLSGLVRAGDTLARLSGDEFVFLCEDMTGPADAELLAVRIVQTFDRQFQLGATAVAVTASVGTAFAGPGEYVSPQLLANADVAMYQAKHRGGAGHQTFDLDAAQELTERNSLERDLRVALDHGDLRVDYQPIVRVADGGVTAIEALLRWTDPARGLVTPLSMIAAAEQSGLIVQIDAWVMETACLERGRCLQSDPATPLEVAVNVSARQLMMPGFTAGVAEIVARTEMEATALVLEITENVLLADAERAVIVLSDLSALGIKIALDDFGTGYSSLSYLHRLPIDILKIDRTFIADLGRARAARPIVEGVTQLAHTLGITVVAEGVETQAQHDEILDVGCDRGQGFFYGRPVAAPALAGMLGDLQRGHAA